MYPHKPGNEKKKKTKYLSTDEGIMKMKYIIQYNIIRLEGKIKFEGKWMNLVKITLS